MNRFILLSFRTINFDAVFDNLFVSLLHWQTQTRFAISTIRSEKWHLNLKKFTFQNGSLPSLKRSCWKMRRYKLVKYALILFQKDWYTFRSSKSRSKSAYFKRYSTPGHFAGQNCDKKKFNVQSPQSRKWLYNQCFPQFFGANINHPTEWKWQALWYYFVSYSVSTSGNTSPASNYFQASKNPHFGQFGQTAP